MGSQLTLARHLAKKTVCREVKSRLAQDLIELARKAGYKPRGEEHGQAVKI